jgi:signal transduction histidine kinase
MSALESGRFSILVVEDEPIVAKDLQLILRDLGFDAYAIANSADAAIKRASERCPDLVLMDIRIKGRLDGIQTAEILRQRFGVSVVYLTAHADDATIERAAATEPYGYLLKPIKKDELRSAIEIAAHRQKLDKGLRDRERWLSTAVRDVQDAVLTTDAEGRLTFINPAAEALMGVHAANALGRPAAEVLKSLDRESLVVQTSPLGDSSPDHGQPQGSVMVLHDVGERQRLQKQLELADRLSSLGTMAASTAHELNNPLTVVMTNAGIIGEVLGDLRNAAGSGAESMQARLAGINDALGDLQAAASRMARIIGDLRAFSRPAENTAERIDLRRCVEWAVRATAREFQFRAHIRTRFEAAPAVIGEPARIEQVLVNLLVNAAHAIPAGQGDDNEVQINVRTAEDGRALVEVRDTGAGMAPEVLARIFDPFFTTKAVGTGTGLGLAICQGIIKALGGEIRVASTIGRGTTFTILLPAAPAEDRLDSRALAPPPAPVNPGRLLVLDDEVSLLRAIQRILEDEGHEVVSRDNAAAGLELLEAGEKFDLIISDLMMPRMTGVDFYEALKSRFPALTGKVAFITGGAVTPQAAAFLDSIANPRLEKPFKVAQLCNMVRTAIETSTAGAPAQPAPKHAS